MNTYIDSPQVESVYLSTSSQLIKTRSKVRKQRIALFRELMRICRSQELGILKSLAVILTLRRKVKNIHGDGIAQKLACVDGRYFSRFSLPGFPSPANRKVLEDEMNRIIQPKHPSRLRLLFLAITNKCPLACEHCFEWPYLNQKEDLDPQELAGIVQRYQDHGIGQIFLSGGEPMVRFQTVLSLLGTSDTSSTDFWIITSGFRLDSERAGELKRAGLTGVMVSLDHYEAEAHNRFRGYKNAYASAINAVHCAKAAKLVVCLSLCVTRTFATTEHIEAYMELARELGVSFVQWLDPRAAGRYEGKDVELSNEQKDLLDHLLIRYNTHAACKDYPLVHYSGYFQRRIGCFGAGDRFLYLNSKGNVQPCPFCGQGLELAGKATIPEIREELQSLGCGL